MTGLSRSEMMTGPASDGVAENPVPHLPEAASRSWYIRGAFGAWTSRLPAADPRLHRLSGTDFCLRLCARDAPRLQPGEGGHTTHFDIRHWHFHAGPLMRSSGQHEGLAATLGQSGDHTTIDLSGVDRELGKIQLSLRFELRAGDVDPADVGVYFAGHLQHGDSDTHRLPVRRAAARSMRGVNDHAA